MYACKNVQSDLKKLIDCDVKVNFVFFCFRLKSMSKE